MIKLKLKIFIVITVSLICTSFLVACSSSTSHTQDVSNQISQQSLSEDSTVYSDGYYEYTIDGITATITKYNGSEASVVIPTTINNFDVRHIDDGAFENNTHIKMVHIPERLSSIGEKAFYGCTNLRLVDFSPAPYKSWLSFIGNQAFDKTNISTFKIPDNCLTVENAFGSNLKELYVYGKETTFSNDIVLSDVTIYGYKDSQAYQQFNEDNGYNFIELQKLGELS